MIVPLPKPSPDPARVTVLLATHNGERWIDEQLDSILGQDGVNLSVLARDDLSTDGTLAALQRRSALDSRLSVKPSTTSSGGSAANFLRLLAEIPAEYSGSVAFADQDDIWHQGKLARHASLLESGVDGVSSDVMTFDEAGNRHLIRKSYPQRRFDFLLESPGPGSTFLVSARLAQLVNELVRDNVGDVSSVAFHDILIYAVCRARGWSWAIDDLPSVDYRQHAQNVMGANVGLAGARSRLATIRRKEHRRQSRQLAEIAAVIAAGDMKADLAKIRDEMGSSAVGEKLRLAFKSGQLRRRPRDRVIIGILIALGIW
jgi:rhamnosyltransferase